MLRSRLSILLLLVVSLVSCISAPKQHGTLACTVTVNEYARAVFYERVVILKDHSNGTDYWVYYPDRDSSEFIGIDGKERAVNIPINKVLKNGEARIISGILCRCPTPDR